MHLKRLEAFGFKSFADKVVFEFEPGFTCLVGPNGCGKSNVVDAVKWVLGEQSAKSLRGGEMLDVIFNGSNYRKPLNYCEVTLTFDNATARLPIAAPEVSVTRRLFRSGESEYLINKALCRLRDIRELFWDTGVGTSSYSIIEQGRIGLLLEANAKERRTLFEEAAGIHKYKERKKIALRKLERVEGNLARLTDVLNEVERQLKTVTRQAEKARQAKEWTERLKTIKLDLLLAETGKCQAALSLIEGSLAQAREQVAKLTEEDQDAQRATAADQETMARLDAEFAEVQHELSEAKAALAGLEEALKSDRRAVEENRIEADRARKASEEAGTRAATLASEREKCELDLSNDCTTLAERTASAEERSKALAAVQTALQETAAALERARREALDLLGRRTQLQQTVGQSETELQGLDYRMRRARAEMTRADDALRFAQTESEETKSRMEQVRVRRETLDTELTGLRALQARTEEELGQLGSQSQELRTQIEKARSRAAVLEDLNTSGEGLSPGARAISEAERTHEDPAGFHGLVAECFEVEPRLVAAVEAALGPNIEALVVGTSAKADAYLARLVGEGLGRATFLPLDALTPVRIAERGLRLDAPATPAVVEAVSSEIAPTENAPAPVEAAAPAPLPLAAGCLGRAPELLTLESEYRPVAEALLGDVLFFETVEQAQAARTGLPGWRLVTLTGAVVEPYGAFSGGKYHFDRLGLIGRRNEIQRLHVEMDDLGMQASALAERTAFLEQRAQKLARDDDHLSQTLGALATTATELKGALSAIEREESRSAEERRVAGDEVRQLEAEREALAVRINAAREELTVLQAQEAAANADAALHTESLARLDGEVTSQRNELEEVKRDVSTLTVRVEGLQRHLQALSMQQSEKREECEREKFRAENLEARCAATEASIAEKETGVASRQERIAFLDGQQRAVAQGKEAARARFEDARAKERSLAQQLDQARIQAADIERQQFELKLRLDTRLEQGRSEFQLDAGEELRTRGGEVPEVSEERMEDARKLEERIQRLGPVNLYALEEQETLAKRAEFLRTHAQDLESARASLRDVISRINRRSRQQFQDTFEAVKANFQEIFRKLFGGGKADLVLEEGEDILEAGIEISARPPGKEPRSIMQLSGGEKAMTTIALLFAVFRSRPAPFCILDEVDAPLDEANVDRFNHIVREFMDRSQFVVISHNKKTMSYADVLYGVTMPEPGVSKRIAVRYAEIEKHLPMEEIERQAKQARTEALNALDGNGAVEEGEPVGVGVAVEHEAEMGASEAAEPQREARSGGVAVAEPLEGESSFEPTPEERTGAHMPDAPSATENTAPGDAPENVGDAGTESNGTPTTN